MSDITDQLLAGLGKAALVSAEADADVAALADFSSAISGYSEARSADWRKVRELATALAPARPELRIFCYLALSAFCDERERGAEGAPYRALAAVLSSLADLIEGGWPRCLPRAPKARDNQLDWLSRELAWVLKERPPAAKEAEAFLLCIDMAQRVGDLHGQATGVSYALFRDARVALADHRPAVDEILRARAAAPATASKAAGASSPVPAQSEPLVPASGSAASGAPATLSTPVATQPLGPAVTAGPQPAAPSGAPVDVGQLDPEEAEDALAALVVRVAAQQRSRSLTDPAPYWMLRALRWASHDFLRRERVQEFAVAGYRTPLPPPPGHAALLEESPKWLARGEYARVLEECEEVFAQSPLFLDLQRLIALALEGLGATAARQAVGAQVVLLLARCPEVIRFRFGDFDSTPMAGAETQTWLEGEAARGLGAHPGGPAPSGTGAAVAAPLDAPLPTDFMEGVAFLQQCSTRAQHRQEQFEIELRLCEFLLRHDRRDVALPIARSLLDRASTHRLAEWRPDLLTRALRIGYQAAQTDESGSAGFAERQEFFVQLCQVSPQDAVDLVARRDSA